jgi:DNA-directed RNA polymerase subunit RPC12/RpoP
MSNLQEQAEKVWDVLDDLVLMRFCGQECGQCPVNATKYPSPNCGDKESLRNWLHINGFPARRPHVHTVAELAQQIIKGSSVPCLTQRIAQNVEAVACPDCGERTLYRERRMVCAGCNSVYPADKWANGEPCACGSMDARYYGIHSASQLGPFEFQQCETSGCRCGGDYRRLTVQELADAAQEEADAKRVNARSCPDCGETSGSDQREGVCLPIYSCECGWRNEIQ